MAESLSEYTRKWRFDRTAEPRGRRPKGLPRVSGSCAAASHGQGGIITTSAWNGTACSKLGRAQGAVYDSHDKRLAVRVEDHPLGDRHFEGTIPRDQYGGGVVMIWDQGEWHPPGDVEKGLAEGSLKFTLEGSN